MPNGIPQRPAGAAIEDWANVSHVMEPILATAAVTGEVLGTPNAAMRDRLGKGGRDCPPRGALADQELAKRSSRHRVHAFSGQLHARDARFGHCGGVELPDLERRATGHNTN